jgi:TonB family protein
MLCGAPPNVTLPATYPIAGCRPARLKMPAKVQSDLRESRMNSPTQALHPRMALPGRAALPAGKLARPQSLGEIRLFFAVLLSLLILTSARAQQSAIDSQAGQPAAITESDLRQQLVGKYLYLRGRYLDDALSFNERGELSGRSPQGSYTLSVLRIDSLNLSRHKLELRGVRYGLHFLGAVTSQDSSAPVDHVRITPRKKWVRISIARMKIVKPPKKRKGARSPQPPLQPPGATTTTSPAYADTVLRQAIGNVFASTLDERMMAALPAWWRAYYLAAEGKTGPDPLRPGVFRVSDVDRKPTLTGNLEAPSNQYAQDHGIAGIALYHATVGADGTPEDVTVARPIGFGLDENAVSAISTARFQAAMKDGKPVPVLLDLVVEFRIYSKRTQADASTATATTAAAPGDPPFPGPYTAERQ